MSTIVLREAALRTVDWLAARIGPDGSLGEHCGDLACFYKLSSSRLYRATGEAQHLTTAQGYFAFAERCAPQLVGEHFAHKVAWGSAEFASVTGTKAPRRLSADIARHRVAAQDSDGTWMADQPLHTRVDQSAEVAIWLLEIAALP